MKHSRLRSYHITIPLTTVQSTPYFKLAIGISSESESESDESESDAATTAGFTAEAFFAGASPRARASSISFFVLRLRFSLVPGVEVAAGAGAATGVGTTAAKLPFARASAAFASAISALVLRLRLPVLGLIIAGVLTPVVPDAFFAGVALTGDAPGEKSSP